MCAYLLEKGSHPATPANMGQRVGLTVDPNDKPGERRAGGRPKRTKSGHNRRPFGLSRWSCSKGSKPALHGNFLKGGVKNIRGEKTI